MIRASINDTDYIVCLCNLWQIFII